MQSKKIEHKVVQQEIALDTYLSKLLEEIPGDLELGQQKANDVHTETIPSFGKHENVEFERKFSDSKKKDVNATGQINKHVEFAKVINPLSVMPEWAQNEFQALFFKVDKLVLATPLIELQKTIKIETLPTRIPGQPSWFMGLLDVRDQRIGVLDTGQLIFGKAKGQQRDLERQPFKSILMTQDGKWGLACDEILSIGRLEPDKVRWRTFRKKRPWLIGTAVEQLTAIIDVNQLVPRRKSR